MKNYPFVIQVLQRFFPCALPDLHLPGLGDVGLPVDDSAVTPAPARRERIKVQRLAVRGAFHRAEDATEFLPGPGGAVGAHALEEGWHFPGGRHALRAWGFVSGSVAAQMLQDSAACNFFFFFLVAQPVRARTATAFWRLLSAGGRTESAEKKTDQICWNTPSAERATRRQSKYWSGGKKSLPLSLLDCILTDQQTVGKCLLMSEN